ncbi:hypothetical protein WNZ15_22080 [Roseibium sp. AS2]|uniref:hypothetical protein n=1 Tax=Roseibium sp. AS2 TaxID=3135781 RepID=UPI0031784D26
MKQILTAALATTISAPAFAHPGSHDGFSGWEVAAGHLLGTPFHMALLLGVVAAAGAALVLYKRSTGRKVIRRRG